MPVNSSLSFLLAKHVHFIPRYARAQELTDPGAFPKMPVQHRKGFSFENYKRNQNLNLGTATKTGTTIVGLVYKVIIFNRTASFLGQILEQQRAQ